MRRITWITIAFIACLWLIVFIADAGLGGRVFQTLTRAPGGDKTGHFLLMGLAALMVNLSLNAARVQIGPLSLLRGSVLVAVVVTAEEFSQMFFASRGFSLIDLAADYAGILVFGWLAARIVGRRERAPSETG